MNLIVMRSNGLFELQGLIGLSVLDCAVGCIFW